MFKREFYCNKDQILLQRYELLDIFHLFIYILFPCTHIVRNYFLTMVAESLTLVKKSSSNSL